MWRRGLAQGAFLALSLAAGVGAALLYQRNHTTPFGSDYTYPCPQGAIDPRLGPICNALDVLFGWITVLCASAAALISASVLLLAFMLIRRRWGVASIGAIVLAS